MIPQIGITRDVCRLDNHTQSIYLEPLNILM
nr:MAG TPA: hypothetical protein [Caudoviricetes sp.]